MVLWCIIVIAFQWQFSLSAVVCTNKSLCKNGIKRYYAIIFISNRLFFSRDWFTKLVMKTCFVFCYFIFNHVVWNEPIQVIARHSWIFGSIFVSPNIPNNIILYDVWTIYGKCTDCLQSETGGFFFCYRFS